MILRIKNKIKKEIRRALRRNVPFQPEVTFVGEKNPYEPLLAGPSTFIPDCVSAQTASSVLAVLARLTPDPYLEFNKEFYTAGLKRFSGKWKHADILTVLYGISSCITVESYLEIGVRRGRSMAMVAAIHPKVRIAGFDMWLPNYAGIENPGSDFVRKELKRVGYQGDIELVDGDSKITVPQYLKKHPDAFFDLITVDGDHTARGALTDLRNVVPRLKIGGILIFDDIVNPDHAYLKKVWDREIATKDRFMTYAFDETGYGVAFAIKKY